MSVTMENRRQMGGDCLGEDVLDDILQRLPAKSFAFAACVSRRWRNSAAQILSRPKLMSALSENPHLEIAVDEIMDKILAEPIRPDFAIIYAGQKFSLSRIVHLLKEKIGSKVPTIACFAPGIIGPDAITGEQKEVEWRQPVDETSRATRRRILAEQHGLVITIGYFPGLETEAIPLSSSVVEREVDSFVTSVKDYASSLSDRISPLAMILLVDPRADIRHVLERLDEALYGQTAIVGGVAADRNGACLSFNIHGYHSSSMCSEASTSTNDRKGKKLQFKESTIYDAVALVFVPTKNHCRGSTRIHFSPVVSAGIALVGPIYKVVSVRLSKDAVSQRTCTWLTCRREGVLVELDGQSALDDLEHEVGSDILNEGLYIGVLKGGKSSRSSTKDKTKGLFTVHEVYGADEEYLFVDGEGIRTGDMFRFYRTDSETGKLSGNLALEKVHDQLRSLNHDEAPAITDEMITNTSKQNGNKVFGGLLFACKGRGKAFFDEPNVDSSAFSQRFPGISMAGMFCLGEIGPPSVLSWEDTERSNTHCHLNFYSSMFLVFSHTLDCARRLLN